MGFHLCRYVFCAALIGLSIFPKCESEKDITTCCKTEDGCCGPDWGLHCCNFIAKICCYGEERIHALHHHNHRHWDRHWIQVTLYIALCVLIISGLLLCCKGPKRQGKGYREYTVLPGYEYGSSSNLMPTAPVQQTFQTTDEYPLIDYRNGQPLGHSLNSNRMAPPPSYFETA